MKLPPPPLVLASASPRRSELLGGLGIEFSVHPVDFDEQLLSGESAREAAVRLAIGKARELDEPDSVILAADTLVVCDHHILGKPHDARDAHRMLCLLAGRRHEVVTGVALRHGEHLAAGVSQTRIRMADLQDEEISWYIETEEPMDKAGAYAIQGEGRRFIEATRGSESNVIGLPVEETLEALARFGVTPEVEP